MTRYGVQIFPVPFYNEGNGDQKRVVPSHLQIPVMGCLVTGVQEVPTDLGNRGAICAGGLV